MLSINSTPKEAIMLYEDEYVIITDIEAIGPIDNYEEAIAFASTQLPEGTTFTILPLRCPA
jgi:hypothetical protein